MVLGGMYQEQEMQWRQVPRFHYQYTHCLSCLVSFVFKHCVLEDVWNSTHISPASTYKYLQCVCSITGPQNEPAYLYRREVPAGTCGPRLSYRYQPHVDRQEFQPKPVNGGYRGALLNPLRGESQKVEPPAERHDLTVECPMGCGIKGLPDIIQARLSGLKSYVFKNWSHQVYQMHTIGTDDSWCIWLLVTPSTGYSETVIALLFLSVNVCLPIF